MRQHYWTQEEDAILRATYGPLGIKACYDLLPRRSHDAIRARAYLLKLKVRKPYGPRRAQSEDIGKWALMSEAELKVMRENEPKDTRSLTGVLMGDPLPERSALGRQA